MSAKFYFIKFLCFAKLCFASRVNFIRFTHKISTSYSFSTRAKFYEVKFFTSYLIVIEQIFLHFIQKNFHAIFASTVLMLQYISYIVLDFHCHHLQFANIASIFHIFVRLLFVLRFRFLLLHLDFFCFR